MRSAEFNEISESTFLGRRVATTEERNGLWTSRTHLELQSDKLFTPENRRRGIQIVYLELLRSYQNAHQIGTLIFTEDRRKQYENMTKHIRQCERAFQNRFIQKQPTSEPLQRRRNKFPTVYQSSMRQALLNCVPKTVCN